MFLTEESEIEKLKKENSVLTQNHSAALNTVMELNGIIKKMEQRYADLIDITSAAIKYHKEHMEDNAVEETDSSLKRNKK